jgi:hypothetical protein
MGVGSLGGLPWGKGRWLAAVGVRLLEAPSLCPLPVCPALKPAFVMRCVGCLQGM